MTTLLFLFIAYAGEKQRQGDQKKADEATKQQEFIEYLKHHKFDYLIEEVQNIQGGMLKLEETAEGIMSMVTDNNQLLKEIDKKIDELPKADDKTPMQKAESITMNTNQKRVLKAMQGDPETDLLVVGSADQGIVIGNFEELADLVGNRYIEEDLEQLAEWDLIRETGRTIRQLSRKGKEWDVYGDDILAALQSFAEDDPTEDEFILDLIDSEGYTYYNTAHGETELTTKGIDKLAE